MRKNVRSIIVLFVLLHSGVAGAESYCAINMALTKPDNIYTDHGNGTVTDHETNLMWMQCSQGLSGAGCATGAATAMNWKQALEAAQTANAGVGTFGYADWRLPTAAELITLADPACVVPSINTVLFPGTKGPLGSASYWTSSPYAGDLTNSWCVSFVLSGVKICSRSLNSYVRLVRGGR